MIPRSETLTTFELGNTLATSGSRTTTLVPCAWRRAYLPRSPCEKSYSFGFCLRPDLFCIFFITLAFSTAGPSRANDPDIIAAIRVNDNEQFAGKGSAHRNEPFFHPGMFWVGNR
jgi:hypothetical protein